MRALVLLALLLWQPPPPVDVSATFTSSSSAVVSWEQPADPPGLTHTCVRIYHAGATWAAGICFNDLPEGAQQIEIPGALSDQAYRPVWGDRIVLAINMDDVGQATLGEARVYRLFVPLLLSAPTPPPSNLAARWLGPGRAVVSWTGPGCLYQNAVLLACYPREASYRIETPAAAGDVFMLRQGEIETRAELISLTYLPAVY